MSTKPLDDDMLTLVKTACTYVERSLLDFATHQLNDKLRSLGPESVEQLSDALQVAFQEAGKATLQSFLQECEAQFGTTETVDGQVYRRTTTERKDFLTRFGEISVDRDLYYLSGDADPESRGKADPSLPKALVPLDRRWGMEGRNVTADVVEQLLFLSGSMASKEAVTAYNQISGLDVSATRVDHIIQKEGGRFREYAEGDPLRRLDGMEAPNDTEAFVVSLDGANLAVREPREKAQERKEPLKGSPGSDTDQPKKSRFKNAMVGSYSFYPIV